MRRAIISRSEEKDTKRGEQGRLEAKREIFQELESALGRSAGSHRLTRQPLRRLCQWRYGGLLLWLLFPELKPSETPKELPPALLSYLVGYISYRRKRLGPPVDFLEPHQTGAQALLTASYPA